VIAWIIPALSICSNVLQVDVENEQGDSEGDNTVAERFNSTLGHLGPHRRKTGAGVGSMLPIKRPRIR
jgi:hypothetical protein